MSLSTRNTVLYSWRSSPDWPPSAGNPVVFWRFPAEARNRLERIFGLIASCGASIHDLSRVTLSAHLNLPRFNMPFELGIAYSLSQMKQHSFFVFEEKAFVSKRA